ncbi:hypothetical protein CAP36_03835 [Chitinophagaceae bacterium IBVUCB2]|nr:hypothetical protein CAP36_03835 [Chitinophagaceae bacterium IBVUCB2]
MKGLSQEQLEFLKKHNVPLEKVFDAKGFSKSYYYIQMKQQGKVVAFNVTPCKRGNHTLRTRNGHCIQCDTKHLEFQKRNDYSGIIYIAGSKNGKVLKVGYSKGIEIRSESLNRTKYAGLNDWEFIFVIFSSTAGSLEPKIKFKLNEYSRAFNYEHDNKLQDAEEVYSCSINKAKAILIAVCKEYYHDYEIKKDYDGTEYNFRRLKKL